MWYSLRDKFNQIIILSFQLMQETKFNLYGEFIRPNGFQKYDILSYIAETREDAIATCRKNNPYFNIITIQVDDTAPEVVKLQSLI